VSRLVIDASVAVRWVVQLPFSEEATLVTADRKFWNALKDTPLASHIHCLGGGPGRSAR